MDGRRDPQSVLVKRSEAKGPLGKIVVAENNLLRYSLKKMTAKFSVNNAHIITNLKKSLVLYQE